MNVVAAVPYLVMITAALGRGKAKDAYCIWFILRHYNGGKKQLASEFAVCADKKILQSMKLKLADKFASPTHTGPIDVANFLYFDNDEQAEMTRRDAYERIRALLSLL